jgi:tyrosyl-tRNA synthetase
MLLSHAARCGHRPLALLGGGTGLIGDPGGRETERPLLPEEEARANLEAIGGQIRGLLAKGGAGGEVLDNAAWLRPLLLVDFLRDVGKHFPVNWMMAKDSVRTRLEDREHGISWTEFAYMLLQAYDFYRLWKDRGCRLQMGGSDQWGNITAGIELIRRKEGGEAFGLTSPLLLGSDGKKFGKSAGNAVWLDPARTSPYRFFQYWVQRDDAEAAGLLAAYTFLPMEEVAAVRAAAAAAPEKRLAQRRLAREVTAFVHGAEAAARAEAASGLLFGETALRDADPGLLRDALEDVPTWRSTRAAFEAGIRLSDAFCHGDIGLCSSRTEFKTQIGQKALHVSDRPLDASAMAPGSDTIVPGDLVAGEFVVLKRGKRRFGVVRVTG